MANCTSECDSRIDGKVSSLNMVIWKSPAPSSGSAVSFEDECWNQRTDVRFNAAIKVPKYLPDGYQTPLPGGQLFVDCIHTTKTRVVPH
jgi:hypothetical protein